MSGQDVQGENGKIYFVTDEADGSSDNKSEVVPDFGEMLNAKDESLSSGKSVDGNMLNESMVSGAENNVKGLEINSTAENTCKLDKEFLCNKSVDHDISTPTPNSTNNLDSEISGEKSREEQDKEVLDFHLDTTPNFSSHRIRVPSYGKVRDILLSDSSSLENRKMKSVSSAPVCFNCCRSHVLRYCPYPRDMREITKNRNKFQQSSSQVQKQASSRRYHLDKNQRFSDLVPGELSKNLRNALNLREDQQPLFIYRMRLLGYPPAWLEEARVAHSGVVIYDDNGVPILEECEEEGEIIPEGAKDRFDISKIIEFPGFNVPLKKNMKEEGKYYRCPALSKEQSKENMIRTLQPNAVQAYKKRSLNLQQYSAQEAKPQMPEKRLPSPTIEEMEEKRRQLLMELNDEDLPFCTGKEDQSTESIEEDKFQPDDECVMDESKSGTPESKNANTLDYGTPILKSISPYSRLPSREQFSLNVSDVINFENLPNTTGKYESMNSLIHKIRDTVTRIHKE